MNKKEFELSAIVWHEVQDKIDVEPLEKLLNNRLNLSAYGSSIKKIYFVFIVVKPENKLHENKVEFHSDTGTLEVALQLNYEHAVASSNEGVQQMMVSLFTKSIDLYEELSISDFNIQQFRKDVEEILK